MGGKANREGLLCSKCKPGYGPAVLSYGHRCARSYFGWFLYPSITNNCVLPGHCPVPNPHHLCFTEFVRPCLSGSSSYSDIPSWTLTGSLVPRLLIAASKPKLQSKAWGQGYSQVHTFIILWNFWACAQQKSMHGQHDHNLSKDQYNSLSPCTCVPKGRNVAEWWLLCT